MFLHNYKDYRGPFDVARIMINKPMLKIIFLAFLLSLGVHANGPMSAFVTGLGELTRGISEVNLESDALGVDQGLIAGAVIGLYRQVEKNPFPTSKEDQFLVKDHMKLGYQLGAGFVASGIVSYVQEWTLVYPVESSMKGSLSRAFLVDLFLPLRVKKLEDEAIHQGMPKDYTLIREVSLQGHGRLKLGGSLPLTLGIKGQLGRVSLNKHLIKRHPDHGLSVMREVGAHWHLSSEIWMNLMFFDLPIADSYLKSGKLTRVYLKVPEKDWRAMRSHDLALALLNGEANEEVEELLEKKAISRKVESRFKETYTGLTFLALFNRDTLTREDYVTQSLYDSQGQVSTEEWWIYQDRHSQDWTTGLQSEELKSQVFLEGKWQEVGLENPTLTMKINIDDHETTPTEFKDSYQPLLNKFIDQTVAKKEESVYGLLENNPYTQTQIIFKYNEEQLKKLLTLSEDDWFMALKEVTGKDKAYWAHTARTGFQGRDRRRLRQNRLTLHDLELAKKAMSILRLWKLAKRHMNSSDYASQTAAYRTLGWAMRRSLLIGRGSWNTIILQAMMTMVPPSEKILGFTLYPPEEAAQHLLVRTHQGQDYEKALTYLRPQFNILLEDPSEIYHHFRLLSP